MSENTWNDPRITAYVLGELSHEEKLEFESEMNTDAQLAAAVDEAGAVTGQLQDMFAAESDGELDEGRVAAIINEPVITRPQDESNSRKGLLLLIGLAASVLLVFSVAPSFNQQFFQTARQTSMEYEDVSAEEEVEYDAMLDDVLLESAAVSEVQPYKSSASPISESAAKRSSSTRIPESAMEGLSIEGLELNEAVIGKGQGGGMGGGSYGRANLGFNAPADVIVTGRGGLDAESTQEANVVKIEETADDFAISDAIHWDALSMPRGSNPAPASRRAVVKQESLAQLPGQPVASAPVGAGVPVLGKELLERQQAGRTIVPDFAFVPNRLQPRFSDPAFKSGEIQSGDKFDPIIDNLFKRVADHPLSTFSADVDTASYSKIRDYLLRANQLPRPDSVRIEELINYFSYSDAPPADSAEHPFVARVGVTSCPWNKKHQLARIAINGKTLQSEERPAANLVFLIDTSGSMNSSNKLPLVIEGMKMLTKQLTNQDRVSIVVYAGSAGMVLDSTSAKKSKKIRKALEQLSAGGSTNGSQGITLAYQTARENFIEDGINRVMLCTDGDFNVGTTGTGDLVRLVENEAKDNIFLSVLGFGMGNHNDAMLEQISGRGNGNYAFIDSKDEAKKVFVKQASGTLMTIAKDVKLQVKFNPTKVSSYRLIGYENRILAKEDFNDDKKDAGEIGAGHSVTALYEIVPAGAKDNTPSKSVDDLKYQSPAEPNEEADSDELMTVKIRYKQPDGDVSTLIEQPVDASISPIEDSSDDVRFTAAVAGFGMLLRGSEHSGDWEMSNVLDFAKRGIGEDEDGLRAEFVKLVKRAAKLKREQVD